MDAPQTNPIESKRRGRKIVNKKNNDRNLKVRQMQLSDT